MEQVEEKQEIPTVQLRSKDGIVVQISRSACFLSNTLNDILGDLADQGKELIVPVPVSFMVLGELVYWMTESQEKYTAEDMKRKEDEELPVPDEFDLTFCKKFDDDMIVQVILGANFMDIRILLDLLALHVASLVRDQSPEELRQVLTRTSKPIPDDLGIVPNGFGKVGEKDVVANGDAIGTGAEKRKQDE